MSEQVRLELDSANGVNAPDWATGDQKVKYWYYENQHSEQWVAKLDGDTLRFTGLDIGWKQIQLSFEQVKAEKDRIHSILFVRLVSSVPVTILKGVAETAVSHLPQPSPDYPLSEWIFNDGELYWISSVLEAAYCMMKLNQQ